MDFALTEEQAALAGLAAEVIPQLGADAGQALTSAAEAGLIGAPLAEDVGGAGLGFLAVHLLLEQVGAAAASLPLWETLVLGGLVVDRFGTTEQRHTLLAPLARGERMLTAALLDDQPGDVHEPQTSAARAGEGWRLSGVKTLVPLGTSAHRIVVPARTDAGGVGLFLVDPGAPGVDVRPQEVVGLHLHAEVELAGAVVGETEVLVGPEDGREALHWLVLRAESGLASLTAGACQGALRLTSSHASGRQQFGRPLAAFQAVGQRLADAFVDAEAVGLAALQAAWRLEEDLAAHDEVAIAAWWAAEAGHRVVHAAHHVHGGIGVDRSYPLHRYYEVIKQAEFALGGGARQLVRLGEALADAP